MDPDDLKKKEPPKSKNQKRNENRRLKKEEGGGDEVAALADKVAAAKVDEAPVAAAAPEDPKDALNKKVRCTGRGLARSGSLCGSVQYRGLGLGVDRSNFVWGRADTWVSRGVVAD